MEEVGGESAVEVVPASKIMDTKRSAFCEQREG